VRATTDGDATAAVAPSRRTSVARGPDYPPADTDAGIPGVPAPPLFVASRKPAVVAAATAAVATAWQLGVRPP